jgi:hypothetical protein
MKISSILIYQPNSIADSIEGSGERLDLRGGLYCEDLDAVIGASVEATLENVFEAGNLRRELLPKLAHSISVGDVVALTDDDGETSHYAVAGCGFKAVRCSEHYDTDADHTAFIRVHGQVA